jgi:hypothetical protein
MPKYVVTSKTKPFELVLEFALMEMDIEGVVSVEALQNYCKGAAIKPKTVDEIIQECVKLNLLAEVKT